MALQWLLSSVSAPNACCIIALLYDMMTHPMFPETRWGLGLQHIDDMPPGNLYNFGLVRCSTLPYCFVRC